MNLSLPEPASTVMVASSPDSTVAEGSSQTSCANEAAGASKAAASRVGRRRFIRGLAPKRETWGSGFDGGLHAAQFGVALCFGDGGGLCRPGKGQAQHFAAAFLARGFDDQLVLARRQVGQRRVGGRHLDGVRAHRLGGAGYAVSQFVLAAAAYPPPLPQV